ncbi:zinc-dependent alcohol dehydrogenase [Tunicatimonas pelagia]|uniref:zinc-dependent alcohol dehydrogenase n=1 Tax=Tunicatimonas pelagia TaxID=931531 RepID=UPI002666CE08|nr:zinc-binding alcohol dehydrogenase [Tunicatimonas pelagia]WKN44100.1 zinc-binding alcohol dehydrogenase [Tunicatimonas pelagia]
MTKTSALWHLSPQESTIRTHSDQPVSSGKCRVEAAYSLISSGTETLVASGQVPAELYQSMQVPYMEGNFSFPIKYGYSLVGKVVEGDASLLNKYVHLLHPHQSNCVVNETDVSVIPDDVPPQRAVLASNLETALNATWDAGVSAGDRVLVIGMGLIGSLVAHLSRQFPATTVQVAEADPARQDLAKEQGFFLYDPPSKPFDVAFHTSGSSAGLQTGIDAVGNAGKVIELSWYGTRSTKVNLGGSFHQQRKRIISSQVSQIPSHQQTRWDYRRRKQTVLELLKDDSWDQFLTATVDFPDTPKLFDKLRQGDRSQLSWTIRY